MKCDESKGDFQQAHAKLIILTTRRYTHDVLAILTAHHSVKVVELRFIIPMFLGYKNPKKN